MSHRRLISALLLSLCLPLSQASAESITVKARQVPLSDANPASINADELIYRRVGANELGAIDVCRGYVNAQLEYASEGHDGDPAGIFALKLVSGEGLHNGLYWPTAGGEPPGPLNPNG